MKAIPVKWEMCDFGSKKKSTLLDNSRVFVGQFRLKHNPIGSTII